MKPNHFFFCPQLISTRNCASKSSNLSSSLFKSSLILYFFKLNDDLTKYQISDDLKREDERLDDLDEQFRVDINWEQKKKWFGFIN